MPISSERTETKDQKSGALPPWLWFWLAIYILEFSIVFDRVKQNILILFTGKDGINPSIMYSVPERVPGIVEILLDLVLFVGVLTVFLPWMRTIFLQRKYGLTEPQFLPSETPQETLQALSTISKFVREYAPGLIVTYNARGKRLSDKAFVYPIGYRKAGLALSGTFLALWNRDHQAAEAVLLHEIEHYRHGDMFVVGAGSLLETIIKRWFLLTAVFVIVPVVISLLIEHITSFREETAIGADLPIIISFHIHQVFVLDIPFIFLMFSQSFFWAASLFTIVVMAIWCAEINADRFVVDTTQSTQALAKAMQQHASSPYWWRWLLTGIHHPPTALRRWLVLRSGRMKGLTFLLLIFPLAWFIRLLFLFGWALSLYLVFLYNGTSTSYIVSELGINAKYFLGEMVPTWIAIAVLIALWPILGRYWEHFFGNTADRPVNTSYSAYLSSTGVVVFVCIIGLILSLLPVPTALGGLTPVIPPATSNHPSGHFKVGEPATIGTLWIVTVSNAQAKHDNGIAPATAGHAFLAIDVSLKNISTQTSNLASDLQFALQDLHGVSYDETYIAAIPPPAVAQNGNVPAGATVQGQLNYEIPISVSQFTLSFKPDWKSYVPTTSKLTIWDINVNSNATSTGTSVPTPTLIPTSSVGSTPTSYPTLQQGYQGTLVNTTNTSNASANAMLSSIVQVQGEINGNMAIQQPLAGSGLFTGSVSSNGAIQFTFIPTDNSSYAAIMFIGTIHSDGSMSGTYTLPGTNQSGTWKFKAA